MPCPLRHNFIQHTERTQWNQQLGHGVDSKNGAFGILSNVNIEINRQNMMILSLDL